MMYADNCCKYREIYQPKHTYTFIGPCMECKQEQQVTVDAAELNSYRRGQSIQSALSNNDGEREFLMSGICNTCYDAMFAEDESSINEDALEECDGCGELMCECTCHENDSYDGDL